VPFLPNESIGTIDECIFLLGPNKFDVLAAPGMLKSRVPIWATVGMHVMLACGREHGMQLEYATFHNSVNIVRMTFFLGGLMVRAVNLAVPKSWANVLVRWEPDFMGLPVAAALTHF
jgi:hypothetical protein